MQRYRTVIVIILLGVLPWLAIFFFALSYLDVETSVAEPAPAPKPAVEEAPPPPEMHEVFVAARPLPVGTLIGSEDLARRSLESESLRAGYVEAGEATSGALRGYAVRRALDAGEPLAWSAVVGPGQRGFLAAVLKPDSRAVTIEVGPATGHAGLIDPGDRVDVILTADFEARDRDRTRQVLARTILEDVRVVAVDRRIEDRRKDGGEESPEGDEERQRTEIVTATLEVSPEQDERLALGGREGTLSLAVRSLAGGAVTQRSNEAVSLRELLTTGPAPGLEPEPPPPDAMTRADAQELEDRLWAELAASEERLRAAREVDAQEPEAAAEAPEGVPHEVLILRGSEPSETVSFLPVSGDRPRRERPR